MKYNSAISREILGSIRDLYFLIEEAWLMNTQVTPRIHFHRGRWYITMVYTATETPFKLICKELGDYPTKKKASIYAGIFQKVIRKDARGNLKTNLDDLHICDN